MQPHIPVTILAETCHSLAAFISLEDARAPLFWVWAQTDHDEPLAHSSRFCFMPLILPAKGIEGRSSGTLTQILFLGIAWLLDTSIEDKGEESCRCEYPKQYTTVVNFFSFFSSFTRTLILMEIPSSIHNCTVHLQGSLGVSFW